MVYTQGEKLDMLINGVINIAGRPRL